MDQQDKAHTLGTRILGASFNRLEQKDADRFLAGIAFTNLKRFKIMALLALILFTLLWVWDIVLFINGKWEQSVGYQIVALTHSFLILFIGVIYLICCRRSVETQNDISSWHKSIMIFSMAVVLLSTVWLTLGDVLTNGSVAAYLGMIFAYASIFILPPATSLILFGSNMVVLVTLLVTVYLQTGKPVDIQIINIVAFTLVACILSRIFFQHHLRDFLNLGLIHRQTFEIEQQVQDKEKLIQELEHTLAQVKTLSGLLPICASCKKIRDDQGYWNRIESYIERHSEAAFSHGLCPDCSDKLYGDEDWYTDQRRK